MITTDEARYKLERYFLESGGSLERLKWFKAMLSELVVAAIANAWEEATHCPDCGQKVEVHWKCQCGWSHET